MALSVSGLYSPSLETTNSDFLLTNSPTPSPTSYKNSSEYANNSQAPHRLPYTDPVVSQFTANDYPAYHQQSPPPSILRSPQLGADLSSRPRGQSASRPTLRLHIANPTEQTRNPNSMQDQFALYPNSVLGNTNTRQLNAENTSPTRRGGETFSEFSIPSSLSRRGSPATGKHSVNPGTSQPTGAAAIHPQIRVTTANLILTGTATGNAYSNNIPIPSSSSPASSVTDSAPTKRLYRASPLVGPQAMTAQGSATSSTNSSVSTAPASIFADEYCPSSVSTPATQESASDLQSHLISRAPFLPNASAAGTTTRHRPLPVPPPSLTTVHPQSAISSKVASPLSAPIPPHLPHPRNVPTRSVTPATQHQTLRHGHGRSSSGDLKRSMKPVDLVSAELAYRLEKRRGKQPVRGDMSSAQSEELEEIPYEWRSEKWKGKQKMRDSAYGTLDSPTSHLPSPPTSNFTPAPPPRRTDTTSESRDIGLPPSLSNQPSRTSIASSHSSNRSSGGGMSENGAAKWKGKGKDALKNLSISSMTGSAGVVNAFVKGQQSERNGSVSSFSNPIPSESPASSFSSSPVIPPPLHAPGLSAPVIRAPIPFVPIGHPPALIPGTLLPSRTNSPRVASPRVDFGTEGSVGSFRAVALSPPLHFPAFVELPLPLNVRKLGSPGTSPIISSSAPRLPPKDIKYQLNQPLRLETDALDDTPMHTHPFDADGGDSDEEGRKLFQEVEAVFVSPSTAHNLRRRPIDTGYGYAEEGYEDDERVYVDDGFDDPNNLYADDGLDDLEREYGFGVSASGQLVGGQPVSASASVSALGHSSINHGALLSRASLSKESARSPSPMRYARRRRDSLFEDDDDFYGPPTEVKIPGLSSPARPLVMPVGNSSEEFVHIGRSTTPSSSVDQPNPASQILDALNPRTSVSPHASFTSTSPSDPANSGRGRQPARSPQYFRPHGILGEELEINFAKNPSPTRYHPTKNIYSGSPAVLAEDKIYIKGKWRMRSPSPGMSPTSPSSGGVGTRGRTTPGVGLRRYASEESLLSAGVVTADKETGRREDPNANTGPGFAPLRSRGFEEFNLTSNGLGSGRVVDGASTPDSFDSGSFNPNQSKKSLSIHSQGGSSSGRQTPILRGGASRPEYADDYGFGRAWTKDWREPKTTTKRVKNNVDREQGSDRGRARVPAKLEKKKSVRRKVSAPRSSSAGGDSDTWRSGKVLPSIQPPMQPMEPMSYDKWIERGLDQTSAAVRGKKSARI
ncbi:hypothetical protein D9757_003738 [Collybiopsis confluens]|uniref:Uncharacterized protein n=1 Tax=Collybiopsis confluens TaxID=2823264 RepID=A0A8H5MDK9_9AGAR|nr:hypothetical protein D9757_003738 [Collybiopsis confluens]